MVQQDLVSFRRLVGGLQQQVDTGCRAPAAWHEILFTAWWWCSVLWTVPHLAIALVCCRLSLVTVSILVPVRALFPFQIHMAGHQLNENCGRTLDIGRMLVMRCTLSSTEAAEEPEGRLWSPYM